MTREEFTQQWSPNDSFRNVCSFAADLDALLSATRRAALEEAMKNAERVSYDKRITDVLKRTAAPQKEKA